MTASNIFDPRPTTYYDENGQIASGAKAYFYQANTSLPIVVYEDQDLTTPHASPVVASSRGVLPVIYIPYAAGSYRVLIRSANDITIYDVPYVPNEAPPSSGGGIAVTTTQIFRTGFVLWSPLTGPLDGFVRMNGRTIGNGSSGATEYAGVAAEDLFSWLWTNVSNANAAVSSGRGASASADWSANKTIVVPSMQGRTPVGADDMGGSAANVIQVSTTINVTNGASTGVVASATGIARGMTAIIDGANVMTVAGVSGTTVTFTGTYGGSNNAAASFRASFFSDAQSAAAAGGSQTITQTSAELASHTHTLNEGTGHDHELNAYTFPGYPGGYTVYGISGGSGGSANTDKTKKATTGATINNSGSALPTQLVQPGMIGTFYIKM